MKKIILLLILVFTITACTTNQPSEELYIDSISHESAMPFTTLTLQGYFPETENIEVIFFNDLYSMSVPVTSANVATVEVGVPLYIEQNAEEFGGGTVSIQVIGTASESNIIEGFEIQDLPTSTYAPGTIVSSFLEAGINLFDSTIAEYEGTEYTSSPQIWKESFEEMKNDLDSGETILLGTWEGQDLELDQESLAELDRILGAMALSFLNEQETIPITGNAVITGYATKCVGVECELAEQKIAQFIKDVFDTDTPSGELAREKLRQMGSTAGTVGTANGAILAEYKNLGSKFIGKVVAPVTWLGLTVAPSAISLYADIKAKHINGEFEEYSDIEEDINRFARRTLPSTINIIGDAATGGIPAFSIAAGSTADKLVQETFKAKDEEILAWEEYTVLDQASLASSSLIPPIVSEEVKETEEVQPEVIQPEEPILEELEEQETAQSIYDGSYTGSYSGSEEYEDYTLEVNGAVAITVTDGILSVTQPGPGSATVSDTGGIEVGVVDDVGTPCTFTGTFTDSSVSGQWTCDYGEYGTASGSWSANKN